MVTMLLQRGADVDARNEDGQSPLLLAVRGRYQGPGCCRGHVGSCTADACLMGTKIGWNTNRVSEGGIFPWGNLEGLHGGGGLRRRWQCLRKENTADKV